MCMDVTWVFAGCLELFSFIQEGTFISSPSHMIGRRPTNRAIINLETFSRCLGCSTYLTYLSPASTSSTGTATVPLTLGLVVVSSLSEGAMRVFKNTGVSRSCSDVVNPTDRIGQSRAEQGSTGQGSVVWWAVWKRWGRDWVSHIIVEDMKGKMIVEEAGRGGGDMEGGRGGLKLWSVNSS